MAPHLEDSLVAMAAAGEFDQMRTILTAGQKFPSKDTNQNLLTAAAKSCHLDVVTFRLIQYTSVPLNEEIVRAAVNTGSVPTFAALLARHPPLINMQSDKRGTPLIVACMGQQTIEYMRFLLDTDTRTVFVQYAFLKNKWASKVFLQASESSNRVFRP